MNHETRVNLDSESVELDYRDRETLEIRIHMERFDVVLTILRQELHEMLLRGFDQR